MTARNTIYRQLFPSAWPRPGLSPINKAIFAIVLFSIILAILETENQLFEKHAAFFLYTETVFTVLFAIEYLLRGWSAGEDPRYKGFSGRLRYLMTPAAIIDLVAILPLVVASGAPNLFAIRLVRLLQILRIARLGRFSSALRSVADAIHSRRYELSVSIVMAAVALIFSATGMYLMEAGEQPEVFGSIPRSLWWSVATLTTVGYGDVYPHTSVGKVFAGLTAVTGIGLIAMPTGILAAAFSEAFQKRKTDLE
ncbi:MAG: ion transporter [Rhodospirillaceae bacterium]|nr:ion transporter [Rhodospirillaceae bacterium]